MNRIFIIIFIFIFRFDALFPEDVLYYSRWDNFFENFYFMEPHIRNNNLIEGQIGLPTLNFGQSDSTTFRRFYNLDLRYGFYRIDTAIRYNSVQFFQGEHIFIGNISDNFKSLKIELGSTQLDAWYFGLGLKDGYKFVDYLENVSLGHSVSLFWSKNDYDLLPQDSVDREFLLRFRNLFKFGMNYQGSISYDLFEFMKFNFIYEKTNLFPEFEFFPFAGAYIFDLVTQRVIDLFERELFNTFGSYYPIIKMIYKNLLSYTVYELRVNNSYFPFTSDKSLGINNMKISLTFIF